MCYSNYLLFSELDNGIKTRLGAFEKCDQLLPGYDLKPNAIKFLYPEHWNWKQAMHGNKK